MVIAFYEVTQSKYLQELNCSINEGKNNQIHTFKLWLTGIL